MNNYKIAPSILSADFSIIGEEVKNLDKAGADLIHIDVMDGVFVPNITFGPKFVKDIRKYTDKTFDTHLMIVHPENFVERFAEAGSDIITVHQEACGDNLNNVLKMIKNLGKKCGAVISPDTPASKLFSAIDLCDMVLIMSVYPGFGGQKFIPDVLPKAEEIANYSAKINKKIDIEIDGGINIETIKSAKSAGVNVFVAGNTVFKAEDRRLMIETLRNA
jgi:ribulose-phosphate 3-epimerase